MVEHLPILKMCDKKDSTTTKRYKYMKKKFLTTTRKLSLFFENDLKMKLTLLFIFISLFTVNANEIYSQKTWITLDVENISIEELFDKIEAKTDFRFAYKTEDVDLDSLVSVNAEKEEVPLIIERLFASSRTAFTIIGEQIILTAKKENKNLPRASLPEIKQDFQSEVTGKITDEGGNPIPGVTIIIKGENTGVISDLDGNYSITVDPNATLIFSHIGFNTQEIPVEGRTEINIEMTPAIGVLSEVVITGIFERDAESFTGSAVTVTSEELKRRGNSNVFQALKNMLPSVVMMDNFALGSNPNALPELQIRGTSTFPGGESDLELNLKGNYIKDPNQPLFILNGFEASVEQIYDLDINRVESITVLKDAASKAIYGSRAANGVVVIETKRLAGDEVIVTYNASVDVEMPDLTSYNLTNALEKLRAEKLDGMYIPNSDDPMDLVKLQQLYNSRRKLALEGLDTDWMAKPLQTGIGQRHSVTAELGSEDLRVRGNISYRKITGVMKGSFRENVAGNLTASYRIDNLSFRNIISVNNNNSEESPYGKFSEYARMNPYWRAVNPDGTIPYYAEIGPNDERYVNPLYNSTLNSRIAAGYFNFTNNFYLEWNIMPELKLTTRVGIDIKKSDAQEFYPSGHTRFEDYVGNRKMRKGSYQLNNGESSYLSGDINLQYSNTFGKHFVFGNAGFNISEKQYQEFIHLAEGFPSDRMDNIIFARGYALGSRPIGIEGITRDIGFLVVGSYMYDSRFLTDITLRTSASSQFGADKRWAEFWSLGLGWNLHNESFFPGDVVERLKIRGSMGSTGNQNFSTNASVATYSYYLESLYQGFPGSYLLNMANSGLQWQSKFDYNIGFDAEIQNLSMRFDYYESYTENLITDITIPYSTGFNLVKENLGKVKNSGFEVNASYLVWANERDFFNIHAGVATNENVIINLSDAMEAFNEKQNEIAADTENNEPVLKYKDGMSMNAIWAVRSLGIDPATGREIYLDRNGNTTYNWNAEDMVVVGNSSPSYRGNFGFSGEFNGIGLSVTARYLGGGQLYNQTLVNKVENVDMNYNVDRRVLTGRWLYQGQQTNFKGLRIFDYDSGNYISVDEKTRPTSRFVQDRNELDIAAVNLYYDFNQNLLDNFGLQRLRVSFNMNELYKFSTIRIERGTQYPFARTMSFSLMATF